MDIAVSLVVGVVVVVAITIATGYFVAQEFAYLAVDRSRLAAAARTGDKAAERALAITRRTSFMLSGAQLGITVTGLLVGYVAEPLIGGAVSTLLGRTVPTAVAVTVGGVVALLVSTLVQMLFGELYPKNYAIARADWTARKLSGSTRIYLLLFGPVIWVFDRSAELFLRLLRIEPVHDVDASASASDLEHVIEESRESGELAEDLSDLLDRIIDFPTRDVEHAMVPRARVDIVRADDPLAEVRRLMACAHTRYPVLDEDDHILGVVELREVLTRPGDSTEPVSSVMQPPLVLSEYMSLPNALATLREHKRQLACVVDEYGGFAGVITTEDLAEEVVGEITDEHDLDTPPLARHLGDGSWDVPGELPVDEVERALDIDLPEGEHETIAGLVIDVHGALPQVGAVVLVPLPLDPEDLLDEDEPDARMLRAEVTDVDNFVPTRLRLTVQAGADTRPAGEDGT